MPTNLHTSKQMKKSVNLSINSELLKKAKDQNINLSQTLEQRLAEMLIEKKRMAWRNENKEAIDTYNRRIKLNDVFSKNLRRF